MEQPSVTVLSIVSAIFEENAYIAYFEGQPEALVIDPGLEPEKIVAAINICRAESAPRYIVAAGCEIPRDTPEENVRALLAACE